MLGKSSELDCLPGDNHFAVIGRHVVMALNEHFMHQIEKCDRQLASCPIAIVGVNVEFENSEKVVLQERLSVGEALDHAVHETRVAQVLQAGQPA